MNYPASIGGDDEDISFEWDIAEINCPPKRAKPTTPAHFTPTVAAKHLNMFEFMVAAVTEGQVEVQLQAEVLVFQQGRHPADMLYVIN